MPTRKKITPQAVPASTASYEHKTAEAVIRPEVGVQPRFKRRKAAAKYAYNPSLAPALQWDAGNPARERGEALIARIEAAAHMLAQATQPEARETALSELRDAAAALKALSRPFLEWAGKAERLSFEVPTLPLFIHERLSTQAILESLKGFTGGQIDQASDRVEAMPGAEVLAWFLDTDCNGLVFRPRQAFFPATGASDNLRRALRAEFDDSVCPHLAGDTSEPFVGGAQIAVKVIDHRGNELMVVRELK
jgi:hypothetical protein